MHLPVGDRQPIVDFGHTSTLRGDIQFEKWRPPWEVGFTLKGDVHLGRWYFETMCCTNIPHLFPLLPCLPLLLKLIIYRRSLRLFVTLVTSSCVYIYIYIYFLNLSYFLIAIIHVYLLFFFIQFVWHIFWITSSSSSFLSPIINNFHSLTIPSYVV